MSADGKRLLDEGRIIVQDQLYLPTLEGPKLYKRNGWYYISRRWVASALVTRWFCVRALSMGPMIGGMFLRRAVPR